VRKYIFTRYYGFVFWVIICVIKSKIKTIIDYAIIRSIAHSFSKKLSIGLDHVLKFHIVYCLQKG